MWRHGRPWVPYTFWVLSHVLYSLGGWLNSHSSSAHAALIHLSSLVPSYTKKKHTDCITSYTQKNACFLTNRNQKSRIDQVGKRGSAETLCLELSLVSLDFDSIFFFSYGWIMNIYLLHYLWTRAHAVACLTSAWATLTVFFFFVSSKRPMTSWMWIRRDTVICVSKHIWQLISLYVGRG